MLDCRGTAKSFVCLGALSGNDVDARLMKAPPAFDALRSMVFSSRDIPERLKGKARAGGIPAVSLYGREA